MLSGLLAGTDDLRLLQANIKAVEGVVRSIYDALDEVAANRKVRHVCASDVWGGPITSEVELDVALGRLREAVLGELDDDTEVRFR